MNDKGFTLFTYRDIPVRIDYSWFVVFALIVVTLGAYYFPQNYEGLTLAERWSMSLVSALLFFISVLLHEFSHSVVAQKMGIEINNITLFIFGGVAQMKGEPEDPKSEFYMAGAGPLCSLLLGLLFLGLYYLLPVWGEAFGAVIWYLGYINLALVAFNILPGFPLDGGRVARAVIWYYTGNLRKATRIVSNIGQFMAFLIIGLGVLNMLGGAFIQGLFLIFLGMFLQQASASGYRMVALREGLSGVKIAQLMSRDPYTVPADITLEELVDDYFYRYRVHSFPVVRDIKTVGMVTVKDTKSVPRGDWGSTRVGEIMRPVEQALSLHPEDDAYEALQRMLQDNIGRLPVVSEGRIVGIVTRRDIMEFVHMREEISG